MGETVNKSARDQGREKKKGKKNDRERENGRPVLANNLLNLRPLGGTLRVGISVTVSGTRSIVYVDGRRRGRTPFIGDVECKKGEAIRIRLEPEGGRGQPRSIQRACDTEVIYIRE